MNLIDFTKDAEVGEWPTIEPPQLPVTIRDMEQADGSFDMHLHMADPCPACGAFNMQVGDYACFGVCDICSGGDGA